MHSHNDIDHIRSVLSYIPADDRDTWIRSAMAIKSEFGESGYDPWDEWSRTSSTYNTRDAKTAWKSIRPEGDVTIASLFHTAKEHGWNGDDTYHKPTPKELAQRKLLAAEQTEKAQADIERECAETAAIAKAIYTEASEATRDNPYLVRKKVSPKTTLREIEATKAAHILGYSPRSSGKPLSGPLLVVPIKRGNIISTLELIDGEGRKTALAGRGSKAGGYWATEPLNENLATLLIGEGVATVLSASEATEWPGIAALSSGNLCSVTKTMQQLYPKAKLIILADLVKATDEPDPNAITAARTTNSKLAIPVFGDNRTPGMTDFNDMAVTHGMAAVAQAITKSGELIQNSPQTFYADNQYNVLNEWPEPQPLVTKIEPAPYPLDALPNMIRLAVEEVENFVKAPLPLVASSALAAISLASQAHIDVKRAEKLQGPVGLFLLTIADSGERKSTCDSFFTQAIRDYEAAQAESAKPELQDYNAKHTAWEAKRNGIKEKIRQLAKSEKPTASTESALRQLEQEKPEPPKIPRLLYGDATPEALAYNLARRWPSAGIVSAEAGVVFGAHGMNKDSAMRNLAQLNVLWDGGALHIDRRSTESYTVCGARLTMALQVQEATIRDFLDRVGALARGTGFLARFLISWPESTQGKRRFTEAPKSWPALEKFNNRINEILNQHPPIDENGSLTPLLLSMEPETKMLWIAFHDAIEDQLASGGGLYDVRDVASKAADNAVRLSALFQLFEFKAGSINPDCFERASRIVAWNLTEARRFLGELSTPKELSDAIQLDRWLIEYCLQIQVSEIPKSDALQRGPLRNKANLDPAINQLVELDRLRVRKQGRKTILEINSSLVHAANAKAANSAKTGRDNHES